MINVIEMSWLYGCEIIIKVWWYKVDLNHLCVLLWHDDDNVLISHMMVVLKGNSHAIPNELMIMNIQGVSLLYLILSFDE